MKGKSNEKITTELSIQMIARVKKIFNDKNWPIGNDVDERTFEDFCVMLSSLTTEESELILQLTESFLWVQDVQYKNFFYKSFNKFINEYDFNGRENICICPLLPEADFGRSKSSLFLFYYVKTCLNILRGKSKGFNLFLTDVPKSVNLEYLQEHTVLCLVDDFIGSGETAEEAIKYFIEKGVSAQNIVVVSLVAMNQGVTYLQSLGYNVFADVICAKGISDNQKFTIEEKKIMHLLENKINVASKYSFGYKGSEALVKMQRTPNNTFPIYWLRNKKNPNAPFPR